MQHLDYFLENSYIPVYGITLLVSLYKYPKYFDSRLKYLPIIFLYTFLNELLGRLIRTYDEFSLISNDIYSDYNWLIYNVYTIIFYLYFFYIYYNHINDEKKKKLIVYGAYLFGAISLTNAFVENFNVLPQAYAYVAGGLVLLYCIITYLKEQGTTLKGTKNKLDILFWLSIGLCIFYTGYLPIKIIRYIHAIQETPTPLVIKRIHLSLIIISYLCFIAGFITMKRRFNRK